MSEFTIPSFYNLNLDLVKTQAWVPQTYYATEGDTGYVQQISLFLRGNPYTSATVDQLNFRAIKPDGNVIDITGGQGFQAVDGQANQFVFQIPKQVFAATGTVECYVYITNSDNSVVASTTHFFYKVLNSIPSESGSISYIASLDDVVKQAHDLYAQAMSTMSEITATKTDTDTQATNFAVDLKLKQQDAEKQADQMLADVKAAMQKTAGDATDYQTKLDDLNKQYISKYNELLAKLPDADTAVKQKISDALAQLKIDEQQKFDEIEMDWVKQKETLSTAITTYENSVTKQLDDLKQQISGISSEKVTKLSSDIDALQQKLASLKLADYYTKKEIDDKLDSFQPKIDLSGYETTAHAEDTYAKKTDIVAPNLSAYETTAHASETYETKADAANHLTKTQADADYASKSDIPDLSNYETKTDADATYAKKADIPASPDLSTYETVAHADETFAKKSDIVSPDLTDYAKSADVAKTYETKEEAQTHLTKTQADADYATKADLANVKPDMSGYVKDSNLADYAKKSDVSPIKTIHVLPNGWPEDQPGNKLEPDKDGNIKIDLSHYVYEGELSTVLEGYFTCDESDKRYAKKSDIPDVSAYLTKTDADADYLAKSDATKFATKDDVKNAVGVRLVSINDGSGSDVNVPISRDGSLELDLSSYEQKPSSSYYITKDDADATYAKKGDSTGSGSIDLSDYLKKSDADSNYIKSFKVYYRNQGQTTYQSVTPSNTNLMLMNFLTKTDADADYAKKTDIPTLPDMSTYLTKTDADATYAKKGESTGSAPDLSQYLTKTDADNTYAKTTDIPDVSNFETISDALNRFVQKRNMPSPSELLLKKDIQNQGLVQDVGLYDGKNKGSYMMLNTAFVQSYQGDGSMKNMLLLDSSAIASSVGDALHAQGYRQTQRAQSSKTLTVASVFENSLSELVFPSVLVPGGKDDDVTIDDLKSTSAKYHIIIGWGSSYFLDGHKLAFAD